MQATEITHITTVPDAVWATDEERLEAFGLALDALRARVNEEIGPEDLSYIRKVDRVSRTLEVAGRGLIHFSFEPLGFGAGVFSLWLHKQLQATEVGHTALHGAFNRFEDAGRFHSKRFRWQVPIDERSWIRGHNGRHHNATNVAGKDPDIHFGPVRLTDQTPHRFAHYLQLPFTVFILFPNFTLLMNTHFTGLADFYEGNGRGDGFDFIKDRSRATAIDVHKRAFRKWIPYYAKEYVLFPALAGPFFWKTLLGNWMSEVMRDVYSAATIYCGHVGEATASYDEGTRPRNRGERYAMQVEASNNFDVSLPVSILCGALDLQIEHHLFPAFPTNRLRQLAPEVKSICEAHGVEYRHDTWPRTLRKALGYIARLSRKTERDMNPEFFAAEPT